MTYFDFENINTTVIFNLMKQQKELMIPNFIESLGVKFERPMDEIAIEVSAVLGVM